MTTANSMRMLTPMSGLPSSTPSFSSHPVDASNEGVAWVFDSEGSSAITHLGFRYGSRTGTPPTYIIGLEGVDSSGAPDGVYKTNGGNCSATFTPPADTTWDGTWQWVALSNTYPRTRGEVLCTTIRYSSGTVDASNFSSFTTQISSLAPGPVIYPYAVRNTSGTWSPTNPTPVFGVRTASARRGSIIPNLYSTRTASTVGHRAAAKISLPAGFGDTFQVGGVRMAISPAQTTGRNPLLKIWDSLGNVLASKAVSSSVVSSSASTLYRPMELAFDTLVTLNFGESYYLGMEVADATSSGIALTGVQYDAAADMADEGGGAYCHLATYNGTSWTDDTTVRPFFELIMDDITEPTGGTGAVIMANAVAQTGIRSF